jgi:hypothetical protein
LIWFDIAFDVPVVLLRFAPVRDYRHFLVPTEYLGLARLR